MPWNYRICRTVANGELRISLREVQYAADGNITKCGPAIVEYAAAANEFRERLRMMSHALHEPVLELDEEH